MQSELLFISVFDFGSIIIGLNHLQSLKNSNIENYMAFVTDQKCYETVKSKGYNVKLITGLEDKGFYKKKKDFGTKDFTEMSFTRYKVISEELQKYNAVWYLDVDTVVLKDLNPYYTKYAKQNQYDIIFQNDIHMRCSGCMLFFSNQKTIDATQHIYRGMNDSLPDQHYFARFLDQNPGRFNVTMFDYMEFPNGLLYFDENQLIQIPPEFMEIKRTYHNNNPQNTVFVHANWMVGIDNKIKALKQKGLWYI